MNTQLHLLKTNTRGIAKFIERTVHIFAFALVVELFCMMLLWLPLD